MHILFLTDNFPPEVNAPASRTYEHCREWVRSGHQITIITCAPNFPKGKVLLGYKNRLWQSEEIDGIKVIRVWSYITANDGFVRRTLDYLSFMISAVLAAPFVRRVDLVVGTSPQFFTACAAYLVSTYKRVPFVFELRDIWPESIKAVGAMKDGILLRSLERLEMFLYRRAACIITVTNSFKKTLIDRGIDGAKIEVVTNGVDVGRFQTSERDEDLLRSLGLQGRFIIGYIGTHGMAHALGTVLDSAMLLRDNPRTRDVRFLFLGDGARKAALKARAIEEGIDNVAFIDSVPRDEVVRYWSIMDLAIIHLKDTPLFETVIPSKLFECMAMGVPVLHGVAGESAAIVAQEKCGVCFPPEHAEALADCVNELIDDGARIKGFSQNGIEASHRYDRVTLADKMLEILLKVGKTGQSHPEVTPLLPGDAQRSHVKRSIEN